MSNPTLRAAAEAAREAAAAQDAEEQRRRTVNRAKTVLGELAGAFLDVEALEYQIVGGQSVVASDGIDYVAVNPGGVFLVRPLEGGEWENLGRIRSATELVPPS